MASDVTLTRLEDSISWYDAKASWNQKRFRRMKTLGIVVAAAIPVVVNLHIPVTVVGAMGALLAALEGIQQLNQYHANWLTYRSTCEALKHEKYLYLAHAAHYASVATPEALLAERIESLVSQEHAKWSTQQQPREAEKTTTTSGLTS